MIHPTGSLGIIKILPLKLRSLRYLSKEERRNKSDGFFKDPEIYAFFIGHLLGDGHLKKRDDYLQIDQASEKLTDWYLSFCKKHILLSVRFETKVQLKERFDKRLDYLQK